MRDTKNMLLDTYKFRTELHVHTSPASPCGKEEPEALAKRYSSLGYHAVALTNHFMYNPNLSAAEYTARYLEDYNRLITAAEPLGLKVILGAEIRFTENINDYLVYGVDKDLLPEIYDRLPFGVEAFRRGLKMPNSVFVQAHPFRVKMDQVDASLLDGVEVFNMHPNQNSRIGLAAKWAKREGVRIITAGSDFHNPEHGGDGLAALRTKCLPTDSYHLASLLKDGDYVLELGGSIILP